MAHLPIDFCRKTAAARRARGMTQSTLARSVGCAQSAISMFESGHPEKLSLEFVRRIAAQLDLVLDEQSDAAMPPDNGNDCGQLCYCPNPHCYSNIPYKVSGGLTLWPTPVCGEGDAVYCQVCGEVLERACPVCARPFTEGAFCPVCGKPRITPLLPPGVSSDNWIQEQRTEIQQWHNLMRKA